MVTSQVTSWTHMTLLRNVDHCPYPQHDVRLFTYILRRDVQFEARKDVRRSVVVNVKSHDVTNLTFLWRLLLFRASLLPFWANERNAPTIGRRVITMGRVLRRYVMTSQERKTVRQNVAPSSPKRHCKSWPSQRHYVIDVRLFLFSILNPFIMG